MAVGFDRTRSAYRFCPSDSGDQGVSLKRTLNLHWSLQERTETCMHYDTMGDTDTECSMTATRKKRQGYVREHEGQKKRVAW